MTTTAEPDLEEDDDDDTRDNDDEDDDAPIYPLGVPEPTPALPGTEKVPHEPTDAPDGPHLAAPAQWAQVWRRSAFDRPRRLLRPYRG